MSFVEKLTGLMARPNQPDLSNDPAPWYMKYGGRALGIVGSFFCILFGLLNALGIFLLNSDCLISGILQVLLGFAVIILEAPCCFFCIDYANRAADIVDAKPLYYKAAGYCIGAIPPIYMCPGLGSVFGCGLIMITGIIYGMMALGKKASRSEMQEAAVNSGFASTVTTNDRASIVNNPQPFSFTGAVGTDSNV